jgi:hypothetical protein
LGWGVEVDYLPRLELRERELDPELRADRLDVDRLLVFFDVDGFARLLVVFRLDDFARLLAFFVAALFFAAVARLLCVFFAYELFALGDVGLYVLGGLLVFTPLVFTPLDVWYVFRVLLITVVFRTECW